MKQISFRIRKDRLLKCMGALAMALTLTTLLLPANAFAVVCCLGDGGGGGGGCPSTNNACNNSDGCGSLLTDPADVLYYVHWYGMARNGGETDTTHNPFNQKCKQRWLRDDSVNPCGPNTQHYVGNVCENGCSDNGQGGC